MTKKALLYIVVLLTSLSAHAQNFYSAGEAGIAIGGAQYFGDLNEKKFDYIRPAGGAFFRYHFNPYISAKVSLNYAHIGYDDKMSSEDPYALKRNLNFQTDIIEASVQAEFNFFRFATGTEHDRFTPYLTGGFGVFYYNPYTTFKDERYYLRPLGTEGQNVGYDDHVYKRTSYCFPIGVGVKYWLRPGINVGFEVADRLTLTDYMDDVSTYYVGSDQFAGGLSQPPPAYYMQDRSIEVDPSTPLGRAGKQRGNPSTRDQYMTAVFTISFQLKVYKCPGYMNRDFSQVD